MGSSSRSTLSKPWHIDTFSETDEDWVVFEVCGILSSLKSTTSLPPTTTPSSGISRGPHFAKVQQQPWTRYPVATGSRHSYLMTVESPTQLSYLMINPKPTVCAPWFNSMVIDLFHRLYPDRQTLLLTCSCSLHYCELKYKECLITFSFEFESTACSSSTPSTWSSLDIPRLEYPVHAGFVISSCHRPGGATTLSVCVCLYVF